MSKMLIVQMNGYTLFLFSRQAAYRQHTYISVCSKQRIYGEIRSTATKYTKTITFRYIMPLHYGESELSAFCTLCNYKMRKMCKVHASRITEICLLSLLHLLSRKKPKRCKIHIPRNMNFPHFRHDRVSMMLIMSIVQNLPLKIKVISVYIFRR